MKPGLNYSADLFEENVRELFFEDTKAKGVVARSSKSKPSKQDNSLHPARLGKRSRELSGGVNMSSLYDKVMPYKEFSKLSYSEKLKYLEGYESKGHSREQIATAWGKKVQAIHDMYFRLRKKNKPVEPAPTVETPKTIKYVDVSGGEEEEETDFNPFVLKIARSMEGAVISEWILKVVGILDPKNKFKTLLEVKKPSKTNKGKFSFSMRLDDTYDYDSLQSDILDLVGVLAKKEQFLVTLEIKEVS
jgi:hypothetical protein